MASKFGGSGADILVGDNNDDYILAYSGNDVLKGMGGNDTLNGGSGADSMSGGFGDDTYYVDDVGDAVLEAADAGHDAVFAAFTYSIAPLPDVEEVRLLSVAGNSNAGGNERDNLLFGNASANTLAGNGGHDMLDGGAGNDSLLGGDGDDTLIGGSGLDSLIGGLGRDMMSGGTNWDHFIWLAANETGLAPDTADVIADFNSAEGDRINLANIDADVYLPGPQAFTFIGQAAFSGVPGEINYYHDGGNTYIQMQTGTSVDVEGVIRLDGIHNPEANWFLLVMS